MNRENRPIGPMGSEYLRTLPTTIPPDRVLVHNTVRPARRLGTRGFRAWLATPESPRLVVCSCRWAPELGPHYRVVWLESATKPDRIG